MQMKTIPCDSRNYSGRQGAAIAYLVVHYTAGNGDTAEDNGLYFARNAVGASAHWFVDDSGWVASVPEEMCAWHCGADTYVHPYCRNQNSIGIELCSRRDARGQYYFTEKILYHAGILIRKLMETYDIPKERILRHYDVTGKICPAPLVEDTVWERQLEVWMEKRFETLEQIPQWGKETVEKLTALGHLRGDGNSLNLSEDMLRLLVILDRAQVFAG